MSNRTIKNRLEHLEGHTDPGDHEYTAVINWEGEDCHYYKDGIEISRGRFFREAPKDLPISMDWGEPISPREADHE